MSARIKIVAIRGTTSYEFLTIQDTDATPGVEYARAEQDATNFERWLSKQPERQAQNDADYLSNRGA